MVYAFVRSRAAGPIHRSSQGCFHRGRLMMALALGANTVVFSALKTFSFQYRCAEADRLAIMPTRDWMVGAAASITTKPIPTSSSSVASSTASPPLPSRIPA
jgi:hypothetical protein